MKKALPIAALLLVLAAGALIFLFYGKSTSWVRAVALAPAESVLFVHLPDIRQSAIRWPRTSLAQIGNEPEMQAFLERPRKELPLFAAWNARMDQINQASPREAFAAVASLRDDSTPRVIAGFSFSGSQSTVEELLGELRAAVQKKYPAGKADIVTYAGVEIDTYADKDVVVAHAIHNQWCLVGNDLELLQATLDRLDGKPGAAASLTGAELYQQAIQPLPADADAVAFGRLDSLGDTMIQLLAAAGQTADPKQLEQLKQTKAFSASLKMDGEQLRDSIFVMSDQPVSGKVMPRRALDLTTADTVLFYASNMSQQVEVPASSLTPLSAMFPAFMSIDQALQKKGLSFADFGKIFGPEVSFLLDWPGSGAQPSLLLGIDVRDSTKARDFLDAASSAAPGWNRQEEEGAVIYASPTLGLVPGPVMALAQNYVVAGFSGESVSAGLERLKAKKKGSLAESETFREAVKLVGEPTEAFGYLDTARFFERSYGVLRPFLGMALALSPDSGKYIDVGKLPSAEVITRHLIPSVYSQIAVPNGVLIESAGTLTFNQAIVGAVAAGVAAALPTIQSTLKGTPSLPGVTPPAGSQMPPPDAPFFPNTQPSAPVPDDLGLPAGN